METECDDRFEEYHKIENAGYISIPKNDEAIDDDYTSKFITMPSDLGSFDLSNSKSIMNHFIILVDGIKTKSVFTRIQICYILRKKTF